MELTGCCIERVENRTEVNETDDEQASFRGKVGSNIPWGAQTRAVEAYTIAVGKRQADVDNSDLLGTQDVADVGGTARGDLNELADGAWAHLRPRSETSMPTSMRSYQQISIG